ncbi:MAG: SPASM domain-containing protein [Bacteroidaceae bacterium]|nr:SPASM domain-containing protein [Bacteroidaceae bacterium]
MFNKYRKHINIELFGGEPLLHFKNEVYPLLKEITKIADTYSKSVSFFFVTNATLITREMIPLFAEINARFQISIDGFKDKHDKVKRDINRLNDSTYNKVMQIIHWLTDGYSDCYINLRVNYDSTTLQHIPELLSDIENIDQSKLGFHLERIWQTKKTDGSGKAVVETMKSILSSGYTVSYMNFSRRSCSCKSSRINQAVISYDRRIYKCSGRNFTEELQEGVLTAEGKICWNQDKLRKRLNIITFKNKKCKACKLLPLCWGPCNQKLLEHPEKVEGYCQLSHMEISLDDYVFMAFNNELLKNKIYKRIVDWNET